MGTGTIDLDKHFRKDSKAREVAERLLTGRAQTRTELVEGLDLSPTTVVRVAQILEAEGFKVRRHTDRSRQAVFQVVDIKPAVGAGVRSVYLCAQGAPVQAEIRDLSIEGGRVRVTYAIEGEQFVGVLETAGDAGITLPPALLGKAANVVAFCWMEDGRVAHRLGDDERQSVLVVPVAAERKRGPRA